MPLLQISILEGRPPELKEKLIADMTAQICTTLGVSRESVRVLIQELPKVNWGSAGQSVAQREKAKS